jgi:putative CocE/NonD family hydrolase
MYQRLFLFLYLCLPFAASAQSPAADSAWMMANYTKREVYIPVRDGIRLYTAIYEPKAGGKHPFLLNRSPYSIAPYGEDHYKAFWNTHYMNYLKENYIIVLQDVRGKYMSEGEFMDVRPYNPNKKGKETDEASDTWDVVDWLLKNVKNNNGKVGVWGISYPGYYATMAALSGHPAIKAVSPQAPVTEWFLGDDFHHNGAFMEMNGFSFYSGFGKHRPSPTTKGATGYHPFTSDNYKFYLSMGSLKNLAAALNDSVQFWNELYDHPNYDQWWQDRNTRKWVQHIPSHIATLEVGGLFDAEDCFGAWNLYKAIEKKTDNNNKIVMGPWSHGGWARGAGEYLGNVRFGLKNSEWYQKNVELPFFNYYLLGKGDINKIHEATIFFSGANKWKTFTSWPPEGEHEQAMYMYGDGSLSWNPSSAKEVNVTPTIAEIDATLENRMNYFTKLYGSKEKLEKASGKTINELKNEYREQIKEQMIIQRSIDGGNKNVSYKEYISDPAKPVPYTEGTQTHRTAEYMTDDQRFATTRPDVLVFQTDSLDHDVTLAGPVVADLFASISTTDVDFVVKLIDVFPDNFAYNDTTDGKGNGKGYPMAGYEMLVRGEIMRGRYRNSFEKPEAFVPDQVIEVKYKLPDVAHVFKKGHRIMVQVQSSWFPLADRNPQQFVDIYHCDNKDFVQCDIKLFLSKEHPSKIILPVLK